MTPNSPHRTTFIPEREFGISYLAEMPFIHIHYCFLDSEAEAVGYTAHEFCCHLCGKSLLVFADFQKQDGGTSEAGVSPDDQLQMSWLFEEFLRVHQACHMTGTPGQSQMYRAVFDAALTAGVAGTFCPEMRTLKSTRDLRTVEVILQ